jgi:FixJ family two-component response regulator
MKQIAPTVFVIDPDESVRTAVQDVVSGMALRCETFASGREFFGHYRGSAAGCVVLEVRIPDMSGLEIQRRLAKLEAPLPLIFLSGHHDVSLAVELMRGGAVHYLQKPLRPAELVIAVQEALACNRRRWKAQRRRQRVRQGIARLTAKERDLLFWIGQGKPHKEIASLVQASLRTVELRRESLMKKLELKSPIALVRFALLAKPFNGGRRRRRRPAFAAVGASRPFAAVSSY